MYSQPNLPKFQPGDSITSRTLNHIANITKSNSTSSQGVGMHGHSDSSGSFQGMDEKVKEKPFWAMITGARRKYGVGQYPTLTDPDCPSIAGQFDYCFPPYNPERCPNFWYAHSWVELIEDYNLQRHGSEVFPVNVDPKLPFYNQPYNNINGGIEIYKRSCRDINGVYLDAGGMRGDIHEYPLYEVNNMALPTGYITQIHPGKGAYFLTAGFDDGMYAGLRGDTPFRYGFEGFKPPEKTCCEIIDAVVYGSANPTTQAGYDAEFQAYLSSKLKEPGRYKVTSRNNDPPPV